MVFLFLEILTLGFFTIFSSSSWATPFNKTNICSSLFPHIETDAFHLRKSNDAEDLYLEEVYGEKALAWVHEQNSKTSDRIMKDSRYKDLYNDLLGIYNSKDQLNDISVEHGVAYSFWQDQKNPRGIYRQMPLDKYLRGSTDWEVLLDVDALAESEQENWVFSGANRFKNRILFSFSRGGGDASVVREFDLNSKKFIENGFNLPNGKNQINWLDENTVYVGLDREGIVTKSGYPYTVKIWRRGTQIENTPEVFRGEKSDMLSDVRIFRDDPQGPSIEIVYYRKLDFFNAQYWIQRDNHLIELNIPSQSSLNIHNDYLYLTLKENWQYQGTEYRSGDLIRIRLDDFLKKPNSPASEFELLFRQNDETFLADYEIYNNRIFLGINKNVSQEWGELKHQVKLSSYKKTWTFEPLPLPKNSNISVYSISEKDHLMIFEATSFLQPRTRYLLNPDSNSLEIFEKGPEYFNNSPFKVEQHFTQSKDGTKIPYYMVSRKDLALNGKNPTVIYAYGGFGLSVQPFYSSTIGRAWLEKGGVYVVANIRGGSEYGPDWHSTVLKENRQKVFDDFFAVSEDLLQKQVTRPSRLGIVGGSNGGLLTGVAFTQRPDLYNAAVIKVPLLDMLRYHTLLAGDSWVAEYGNPDIPSERKALERYSPYHNIHVNKTYPEVFFLTSTADDRVHPGHARKMASKMQRLSLPFLFYENTEGGHGGSSNNDQLAHWNTIEFIYLYQKLMD